jgi:thiosulfate dehydrogenase
MKLNACLMGALALAAAGSAMTRDAPAADAVQIDLAAWTPPSIRSVGDDPFGKLVKYGHALITDTANQIGPTAADPAKRYSGNNLTCQNCHLQAGTQVYALPLMGVWGQFPQYRGREGEIGTLEERINGCMERSMNGRVLPLDGLEMKAYLAYMRWLSTGIPDGAKLIGAGTKNVKEPGRAADLERGAKVFTDTCAICHGQDGLGKHAAKGGGYQFPPLVGPDTYNNGAGMTRVLTSAGFVRHNMPLGTTFDVARHLVLPTLTLALVDIGQFVLITRSSLVDVLTEDFVTTAKAKGMTKSRVVCDPPARRISTQIRILPI